jgi:hypothetical protein
MKKLLVAALAMTLSVAAFAKDKAAAKSSDGKLATVSGWVSDEKCGAAGAKADHADCAKKCIEGGKAMVLVNDKDQSVWTVKNPDALKGHEGHHVKVKAHVYDDKSVHIESVSMMKEKASKGDKKAESSEHKS